METDRILLRHWRDDDAETLFKWASDPDVGPRAGWPLHKSVEESREVIKTVFNNDSNWAIVLKATGETCIDENQYQGANRPIRVLRLEFNK